MSYILEILADNEEVRNFYLERQNHTNDSGVDLYVPTECVVKCGEVTFLNHAIKCRMLKVVGNDTVQCGYYLYPRSSISKTPLMLANSVGIIDASYRGNIIAALRYCIKASDIKQYLYEGCPCYTVEKGTRLVQICAPDLSPITVRLVDSLDETLRSEGGFGSTGK